MLSSVCQSHVKQVHKLKVTLGIAFQLNESFK